MLGPRSCAKKKSLRNFTHPFSKFYRWSKVRNLVSIFEPRCNECRGFEMEQTYIWNLKQISLIADDWPVSSGYWVWFGLSNANRLFVCYARDKWAAVCYSKWGRSCSETGSSSTYCTANFPTRSSVSKYIRRCGSTFSWRRSTAISHCDRRCLRLQWHLAFARAHTQGCLVTNAWNSFIANARSMWRRHHCTSYRRSTE